MRVILLGTGTPYPTAERFGSAILVEAGGRKLLFDCGRGAVIRLGQAGVSSTDVEMLFLTHLHADHTVGIPDLWLTGWFLGRNKPLEVWGPSGTRGMMEHLLAAYQFDVRARVSGPESLSPRGAEIVARDIEQGVIDDHEGVKVTAFLVDHGTVKPSFGYRVDYAGHSVVISGDTKFSQNLIDFSRGTDCLIHAAWKAGSRADTPEALRSVASGADAGRVFALVRPKLAIVYHYADEAGLAEEVRSRFNGPFLVGRDLMVIEVGRKTTWRTIS
jgi:ribonuclease Z